MITVLHGLQDLGKVLGLPLGEQITGETAAEAAHALRARAEAAEQAVQRVRDLAAHWEWFGSLWSTAARRIPACHAAGAQCCAEFALRSGL